MTPNVTPFMRMKTNLAANLYGCADRAMKATMAGHFELSATWQAGVRDLIAQAVPFCFPMVPAS